MVDRHELLDLAVEILRRGDPLTLDALAKQAGLTKAGVIHHFSTKETLMIAVVDHIVDSWETDLRATVGDPDDALARLRAYVDYAFTGDFDASDLALLADIRLRERLREQWTQRLEPWLGPSERDGQPAYIAARLLADGAWFNEAAGIPVMSDPQRQHVRRIALNLIDDCEPT